MKQNEIPRNLLEELEQIGLTIKVNHTTGELRIGSIIFQPVIDPEHFASLPHSKGIILRDSTQELRRSLESKRINYIDRNGNLSISTSKLTIKTQRIKQRTKRFAASNIVVTS